MTTKSDRALAALATRPPRCSPEEVARALQSVSVHSVTGGGVWTFMLVATTGQFTIDQVAAERALWAARSADAKVFARDLRHCAGLLDEAVFRIDTALAARKGRAENEGTR